MQDWLIQTRRAKAIKAAGATASAQAAKAAAKQPTVAEKKGSQPAPTVQESPSKKKLSYKEQRERDALPGLVAQLEEEQRSIRAFNFRYHRIFHAAAFAWRRAYLAA